MDCQNVQKESPAAGSCLGLNVLGWNRFSTLQWSVCQKLRGGAVQTCAERPRTDRGRPDNASVLCFCCRLKDIGHGNPRSYYYHEEWRQGRKPSLRRILCPRSGRSVLDR